MRTWMWTNDHPILFIYFLFPISLPAFSFSSVPFLIINTVSCHPFNPKVSQCCSAYSPVRVPCPVVAHESMESQILPCHMGYVQNVLLSFVMVLPQFRHQAQGGRDALWPEGNSDMGLIRSLDLRARQISVWQSKCLMTTQRNMWISAWLFQHTSPKG